MFVLNFALCIPFSLPNFRAGRFISLYFCYHVGYGWRFVNFSSCRVNKRGEKIYQSYPFNPFDRTGIKAGINADYFLSYPQRVFYIYICPPPSNAGTKCISLGGTIFPFHLLSQNRLTESGINCISQDIWGGSTETLLFKYSSYPILCRFPPQGANSAT